MRLRGLRQIPCSTVTYMRAYNLAVSTGIAPRYNKISLSLSLSLSLSICLSLSLSIYLLNIPLLDRVTYSHARRDAVL